MYAEVNAILLTWRIPGYKRDILKLLTSSIKIYSMYIQTPVTLHSLWQSVWVLYKLAVEEVGLKAVTYNNFCTLLRILHTSR